MDERLSAGGMCCSVLQCVAVCCSEIEISESRRDLEQVGSEPWDLEKMRSETWIRDLDQKWNQRLGKSQYTLKNENSKWQYIGCIAHLVGICEISLQAPRDSSAMQLTATRCNTLQHAATHCNALQHTTPHSFGLCKISLQAPRDSSAMQLTATRCNTLQHTFVRYVESRCRLLVILL